MNYQQCIDQIRDLGFADDEEMAEFNEVVPHAINMAIAEINNKVPGSAPRNEQYDFTIEESDDEMLYLDMEDIDDAFLDFAQTAMLYDADGTGKYVKFNDFDVINESTVVMDPAYKGDFRILYKAAHETFTGASTQLADELPLARKVHYLVPLLAGYYVWLEDEPAKADEYMSLYKQAVSDLKNEEEEKPRGRIVGGGI